MQTCIRIGYCPTGSRSDEARRTVQASEREDRLSRCKGAYPGRFLCRFCLELLEQHRSPYPRTTRFLLNSSTTSIRVLPRYGYRDVEIATVGNLVPKRWDLLVVQNKLARAAKRCGGRQVVKFSPAVSTPSCSSS
eukprot:2940850-Rhodomonas_salina.1